MSLRRVLAVAWKECREIFRDRLYFGLAFVLPVILMIVYCYGLVQDVENAPFAILDHDRSALSRDYARRFMESRYFDFEGYISDVRETEGLLVDARVRLVLVVPPAVVDLVKAQLASELAAGEALGPRWNTGASGGTVGEFAVRMRPGMRKAVPLGKFGEIGVEAA